MDLLLVLLASFLVFLKRKTEWVILIILALGTDLFTFSYFFKPFCYIPNMQDGALILILLLFLSKLKSKEIISVKYSSIKNYLIVFGLYLSLVIFIDILYNNVPIISIVRTSRAWLCLLFIFVVPKISTKVINKVLRVLLNITLLLSFIIILEFFLEIHYFTNVHVDVLGVVRGALPSYYSLFFTFLLFAGYYNFPKKKKYLYLAILILSQLVSSTRSIALAIIMGIIICLYFKSRKKAVVFLKVIAFLVLVYLLSFSLPGLNERFNDAIREVSTMGQGQIEEEGNTTFRLLLLSERYEFLKTDIIYYLFGIGNVVEEDFPTIFQYGLYDHELGRTTQLNTGDIAWPLIILRFGMIGLVIFVLWFLKFIKLAYWYKHNSLSIALIAYLISNLFVISFAGSICAQSEFWLIPSLCVCLILRESDFTKKSLT